MSKYQVHLAAEASSTAEKTTVIKLKAIRAVDEETWYGFPEELQALSHHKKLTELTPIKNAISSIKARGQYRKILKLGNNYRQKEPIGIYNGIGVGHHHYSEDCHSSTVNMKAAALIVLVLTLCALATSAKHEIVHPPEVCLGCITPYHGDIDVVGMIKKHEPSFRPRKILEIYSQLVEGIGFFVVYDVQILKLGNNYRQKEPIGIYNGIGVGHHHYSEDCHSSTVNMKAAALIVLVLTLSALATSAKHEIVHPPEVCLGCITPYHGDIDVVGMIKRNEPSFRPRKILEIYSQLVEGLGFFVVYDVQILKIGNNCRQKKPIGIYNGIGVGHHHCSEDCHSSTVNMKVAALVVLVLTLCALATSAKPQVPHLPGVCLGCITPYHGDIDVVGMIKRHVPSFRPRKILEIYSQMVEGIGFFVVYDVQPSDASQPNANPRHSSPPDTNRIRSELPPDRLTRLRNFKSFDRSARVFSG
ncbi:hypothetical protein GE061_013104 [Apolygus lucorum]|uniref:Uncharacterized protein n=1 Tax=Apolygus lucorum TaxID=248454 RepID=A0A8S9XVI8_APOLU|nr:hypothetical protein GE061_013104 [Apolygus lucorum]